MKDELVYLAHIQDCLDRIGKYTMRGRNQFFEDTMAQDAVIRNLQTLAEACQKISEALKSNHQEVDWKGIYGLRNVLVHDYLGIDLEQIWDIIEKDLPQLKKAISKMANEIKQR